MRGQVNRTITPRVGSIHISAKLDKAFNHRGLAPVDSIEQGCLIIVVSDINIKTGGFEDINHVWAAILEHMLMNAGSIVVSGIDIHFGAVRKKWLTNGGTTHKIQRAKSSQVFHIRIGPIREEESDVLYVVAKNGPK